MAFSQPLSGSVKKKGQTAMVCQLCETDPKLKFKCLECGLLMCQRCTDKVHPKFASAANHTIKDIKDISKCQTDSAPKPDLTGMKCSIHSEQNCCLFCKTCDCLVCQTCIAKTHIKHEFTEISDEYQTKIGKVKIQEKELESAMQNLTMREGKLKNVKLTERVNYDKVKQEILDFEKSLVNQIKKHTKKLLEELDQKWEALSKSVNNEMEKLKKYQSQIQGKLEQMNNLIQPINGKEVFSLYDSLLRSLETDVTSVHCSFQGVPKFTQVDQTKIPLVVGKLEDTCTIIPYNAELQVETEFETDLEYITSVVSSPDGSLWLCDEYSACMKKVIPNGDNLSVISNFDIKVKDAALLPTGDLLLSVQESSNLKLIPSGSTDIQDSVYMSSLYSTRPVHVAHDNNIIVGIGGSYDITAKKPTQVIVMDQTGRFEKVLQFDNKPIFTIPYRITSDKKGNIAVVDVVSDDQRGRVVVLDQEGEVRNIYTGHPDVNNEENPFKPRGITTTPSDNFVVADFCNHTLTY